MHFHFTMLNHDEIGKKTLFDMYYWFRASLEELGHAVTFSDHLNPFAINAIWENFSVESGSALAESGLQYGIVATEIPVNGTFNNRSDGLWGRRWAGFLAAAKNALFIWSMVDKAIAVYEKMAPACFIELGFTQALVPAWVNCKVKFKYDFCFLGNITEYRRNMLKRLEKEASVFYSNDFFSWGKMGEVFKMCKIGLALRLSEDWPIPSPTRIGRLLHSKRGIASEWTLFQTRQSQLVRCSEKSEDFCDYALHLLSTDWEEMAEERFQQYRKCLPMKNIMHDATKNIRTMDVAISKTNKVKNVESKMSDFLYPPKLLKTVGGYNVVSYKNKYFAIPLKLGAIRLEDQNLEMMHPHIIHGNKLKVLANLYWITKHTKQ